jgi:hypothetical protein
VHYNAMRSKTLATPPVAHAVRFENKNIFFDLEKTL